MMRVLMDPTVTNSGKNNTLFMDQLYLKENRNDLTRGCIDAFRALGYNKYIHILAE